MTEHGFRGEPWLVLPETEAVLATVLRLAHQNCWRVLPMGAGSKLRWGGLVREVELVVSLARLDPLIEHATGDLTVTVAAGMPLARLQEHLKSAGQFVALDPAYPTTATLGGILATADSGSLRHRYGGVRDLCLGLTVIRADGERAKCGGRVVKNVAGYDLMKLFTGSYGTLGIISQMTLRLYPIPPASQTLCLQGSAANLTQALLAVGNSTLTPSAVDIIANDGLGLALGFQSTPAGVAQQVAQFLSLGQALGLTVKPYTGPEIWQGAERVVCKVGVPVTAAVALAGLVTQLGGVAVLHGGGGMGHIRVMPEIMHLQKLRTFCEGVGGYLSILEAPTTLKETFDVWGYKGNALGLMERIKKQFDPLALLSPGRFVGGI